MRMQSQITSLLGIAFACAAVHSAVMDLQPRTIHCRAVEAVIWGMPAVNYARMQQAAMDNGAKLNQVVYWSRPVNWKNQTLTPNPDTISLTGRV